jgi:hypothetical protein
MFWTPAREVGDDQVIRLASFEARYLELASGSGDGDAFGTPPRDVDRDPGTLFPGKASPGEEIAARQGVADRGAFLAQTYMSWSNFEILL